MARGRLAPYRGGVGGTGQAQGRTGSEEVTLYKSLGFGALDLAALEVALSLAESSNAGVAVEWSR